MREITDFIILIFLVVAAAIDYKRREIPLLLLCVFSGVILVLTVKTVFTAFPPKLLGGIIIGCAFFMVSKLTKQAIGYGDSWIILLLGLYLGGYVLLHLLLAASFLAGLIGLIVLWKKRWNRKTALPFVPFIAAAYIGVVVI